MALTLPIALYLGAGLLILLLGRRLFWLYVGMLGFLLGYDLAGHYLVGQPEWLQVAVGMGVGLVGGVLAVFMQVYIVGVAGFVSGAYLAVLLIQYLAPPGSESWLWIAMLVAGGIGLVLFLVALQPALVLVSATLGAAVLVSPFPLDPLAHYAVLVVVAVAGALFQFMALSAEERKRR